MRSRTPALAAGVLLLTGVVLAGQERVDRDVNWRIRQEGTERSQIMRTLHFLTDVYGPRLTGSPNLKNASDWAVKQLTAWGLENAHLEPWKFGHPGWLNERFSAHIISPVKDQLTAEVLAWTPSTNGTVAGRAVQMPMPERVTKEELDQQLAGWKDRVGGRMVLVGEHQKVSVTFSPPARRREENDLRNLFDPDNQAAAGPPAPAPPAQPPAETPPRTRTILTPNQINEQVDAFLVASGALVRINDAGRDHGQIRAFNNRSYDVTKTVPTVMMRNEDFGRISRILAGGTEVELEVTIVNRTYPEGATAYNVIAELSGTDKRDEVIMLGGHIDSWHAATGATDNGIGVATMMEAIRILKAIDAKPRRTIRLALWSGEEQGLLGSQAYVKEHFGTVEDPKPAFHKFGGYFNIDSGTGRARGATVFGPPETAAILRAALSPFSDLGVIGSTTTRSRRRGGSDHTSFNEAGLPGISMMQDPIEYQSATWHTNLDTYERIVEEDAKSSAITIAAAVYHLAMRDDLLPRLEKDQMPPHPNPPAARTPTAAAP
jgi:hypothetical protein